ncbi:hypothetical protein NEE01_18265 [Sphingomonas sp. MMSM24]|uniref:Uncharacterized protein n=1 Tax=Sphingomonas lycopersici TaxID=2951807 RepID=A0AA41ZHG5_9SPHN|nr:hypothetical protein [Sphingomonas lycopersici]MCW6536726.1 hypothetical protein [Sphingomonas lycopersici]
MFERARESGVLDVDPALDPFIGSVHFAVFAEISRVMVDLGQRLDVSAIVAVHIDNARGHPTTLGVDLLHPAGVGETMAKRDDLAVPEQDIAIDDLPARAIEDRGMTDQKIGPCGRHIGAGVRIDAPRRHIGRRRIPFAAARRDGKDAEQQGKA